MQFAREHYAVCPLCMHCNQAFRSVTPQAESERRAEQELQRKIDEAARARDERHRAVELRRTAADTARQEALEAKIGPDATESTRHVSKTGTSRGGGKPKPKLASTTGTTTPATSSLTRRPSIDRSDRRSRTGSVGKKVSVISPTSGDAASDSKTSSKATTSKPKRVDTGTCIFLSFSDTILLQPTARPHSFCFRCKMHPFPLCLHCAGVTLCVERRRFALHAFGCLSYTWVLMCRCAPQD